MTSKSLMVVGLKIAAIIIFVDVVQTAGWQFTTNFAVPDTDRKILITLVIGPVLLTLAVVGILWWCAIDIERKGGRSGDARSSRNLGIDDVGSIILSILGVYVFCYGIINFIYHAMYMIVFGQIYDWAVLDSAEHWAGLVSAAVEIILGLILVIRVRRIFELIMKARRL